MKNSVLNISIPVNIGEINEIKMKRVTEKLSHIYSEGEYFDNQVLNLYNPQRTKTVSIYSDSIQLSSYNPEFISSEDISNLYDTIANISDVLMINSDFKNVIIRNNSSYELNEDSMNVMKNLVSNTLKNTDINSCLGAGFRFFYKNNQGLLDEFKFEPLISNSNFIYSEGIYNYNSIPLDKLKAFVSKNLDEFKSRFDGILNSIK